MQATTDPGEVSSENLAASIADEFERLRFSEKESKGTNQWYESFKTRTETLHWFGRDTVSGAVTDALTWVDVDNHSHVSIWRVPETYASGDLTITLVRRSTAAAGTSAMGITFTRFRDATADAGVVATSINFTPGDTLNHTTTHTYAAANFAVGDFISISVDRAGSVGGDTNTGIVAHNGLAVSFLAYAGRP